ncbi:MAG TPA: hypothetical protein VH139_09525 [Acidobacteriaceae bacterium]|jgi:hypothetical protein|nr:hypothetical protein [Acidobacteriaceae bacterium]
MEDRSVTVPRWSVVRMCESSRHQRQLLAQAYQQVFPQVRQRLASGNRSAGADGSPTPSRTAARLAAGA